MASALRATKTKFCAKFLSTLAKQTKLQPISDLFSNKTLGRHATIKGWVKRIRKQKNYKFLDVNDGSCGDSIQVVVPNSLYVKELTYGSSVCVTGTLDANPNGKIEVHANSVDVIGSCNVTDGYPFTPGQSHSLEYCRKFLHHRLKLPFFCSMLRVRQSTNLAVHKYFTENDFIGVHTPILTGNDCEGAGDTFLVKPSSDVLLGQMRGSDNKKDENEVFFNNKAFLTVSGQLHLEVITRSIPRVYTFNPTFRAENSKSRLHLSEFYMVEAEEGFISGIYDIIQTMESLVKSLISNLISCASDVSALVKEGGYDVKQHLIMLEKVLDKPFAIMKYSDAKDIIERNRHCITYEKHETEGLTKEEEIFLVKYNDDVPVFIVDWPKSVKPFYAKSSPDNENEVQAVDLLAPNVGELCGGSVREDDLAVLSSKCEELGLSEKLQWYIELRKYGNIPTGGFGMGFERFLQFGTNVQNIKDTIPFPRWPHNIQL